MNWLLKRYIQVVIFFHWCENGEIQDIKDVSIYKMAVDIMTVW